MDITGLILRSVDVGEYDKILTIATPERLYSVRAKSVRKPLSKLKGSVGVLTFGEFSLTEGRNGYLLSGTNPTELFGNCWTDPDRYGAAMFCLELFEKCERNGEKLNFFELVRALSEINYGEVYPPTVALKFGVECAVEVGVDVTEGVFPADVGAVFSALLSAEQAEGVLSDATESDIKKCMMHLAAGFKAELGIVLTVAIEIFRS
ncbi:MAG: recombination protein O N-terminal domain-containing protein [Clostridia bacterium]|nr:recombination protein O N-terminal domain-containing protein [Clostridia bacterium]